MATSDPLSGPETRGGALVLVAVIVTIVLLKWAAAVFIPLVLALLISYALAPLVDRLAKIAIPRALSAAVLLLAIVGGAGYSAWSLRDEAVDVLDTLPEAVQKFQEAARKEFDGPGKALLRCPGRTDAASTATATM